MKLKPTTAELEQEHEKSWGWRDQFAQLISKSGFPHKYDAQDDSFIFHYDAKIGGTSGILFGQKFDDINVWNETHESIKGALGRSAGNAPNFQPTDEELGKINRLAGRTYKPEEVKVYYTVSAGQNIDRHYEKFSTKALEQMAAFSIDSPVMKDHMYFLSDGVFGKIFDAKVMNVGDGKKLVQKVYVLNTQDYQKIIDGIESGINNKLSVGIRLNRKDYHCDVCNKAFYKYNAEKDMGEWCGHRPGQELKDGTVVTGTIKAVTEFLELSRVTIPAQREAAITGNPNGKKEFVAGFSKSAHLDKTENAAIDVQSSNAATISLDAKVQPTGESTVKNEATTAAPNAQGVANADAAKADAAQTAAPAATDADAGKSAVEANDIVKVLTAGLEAFAKAHGEILKEVVSQLNKNNELLEKMLEHSKDQSTKLAEDAGAFKKQMEIKIAETSATATLALKAHTAFAEKCGVVVGKSIQDMSREVANAQAMGKTAHETEKQLQDDYYAKDFVNRF